MIWKHLWPTPSDKAKASSDIGTMYVAKTFLGASNVPDDPIKDFYACEDLLLKYTEALILSAALIFFEMDGVKEEPKVNLQSDDEDDAAYTQRVFGGIVDTYAIRENHQFTYDQDVFPCPVVECEKVYKTKRGLKAHKKAKHPECAENTTVSNYVKTALGMCLMALDFTDARKHGDGERLIRLYKFLILQFRAVRKDNYALYSLRLIMLIKALLTPKLSHQLTWNRFVNRNGKVDSNNECDKELEMLNKDTKGLVRGFHGKISEASIHRVSRSTQSMVEILDKADKEAGTKSQSGKHARVGATEDVLCLVEVLHHEDVFRSDRKLKALPNFKGSPYSGLDMEATWTWMHNSVDKYSDFALFQER